MTQVRVLAFAGSARAASLNKRLLRVAADAVAAAGAEVTVVDLDDYALPVYHGDLEAREGMPANARTLREMFLAHGALLVASPENNGSISALLKNTLDWISRPVGGRNGLVPYQGKVAALVAASPGGIGGVRGLAHLRAILERLGVLVLPEQFALPRAHEAFTGDGALAEPRHRAAVAGLARRLVEVSGRLAG
ncbi:MAG: NAD(P)H-dependent oxidoreductase [Burkholderiales bacterium]|nr:NAD(P)H-dependent oxidoreductase [Burkholderiales bacterium]